MFYMLYDMGMSKLLDTETIVFENENWITDAMRDATKWYRDPAWGDNVCLWAFSPTQLDRGIMVYFSEYTYELNRFMLDDRVTLSPGGIGAWWRSRQDHFPVSVSGVETPEGRIQYLIDKHNLTFLKHLEKCKELH